MKPIVVVGAGAAGVVAALFARRAGRDVVLVERTSDGGRKILISGGGRCNLLPARSDPARYVTASSVHSLRNILRSWPLADQRTFFERELAMRLVLEPETGKLFPETHRARDVRDRLMKAARDAGTKLWFGSQVTDIRPMPADSAWAVHIKDAPRLEASSVVLATGGLSVPKTGSDGIGLAIARRLGHSINPTYPALTPLTATPTMHAHLAGVSLHVTITAPGARPRFTTTGGFLFTHRGYSGPAVLDASHLATRDAAGGTRQPLLVQWTLLDGPAWDETLRHGRGSVARIVALHLPVRLAEQLVAEAGLLPDQRMATLDRASRRKLVSLLTAYPLLYTGDEGFKKAEVTGGGVDLGDIDPTTMESRRCPGLYLGGEMLDAFGPIGGHNFVWAFATGRAAGLGAARSGTVS